MTFLEWILNKLGKQTTERDAEGLLEERPTLKIEPPRPIPPPREEQNQKKEEKRVVIIDL